MSGFSGDLFGVAGSDECTQEIIKPGAVLLRHFAARQSTLLLEKIERTLQQSPLRTMSTPGGRPMSVKLSNCGHYGWVSDSKGYRYVETDPVTGQSWPAMPTAFSKLAEQAAMAAGYECFTPDVCLINCYEPGSRMGLHQDRDERDFSAPIVSVSLGVTATFQFGGAKRTDKPVRVPLMHGDVVVWGGESRLNFHGVLTLRKAYHPLTGDQRINLTFRKAS